MAHSALGVVQTEPVTIKLYSRIEINVEQC